MQRVLDQQLLHGQDDRFYNEGQPFTGIGYDLAPEGWIRSEQEYRNGTPDGNLRSWYSPGRPESEAAFRGGLFHGPRRTWHENGRLASEEVFEHGVRFRGKRWDEGGILTEDFQLRPSDPEYAVLLAQRRFFEEWRAKSGSTDPA
jgi:antitoxin component YwqK of YwqJK toxin-antitoxin module